MTSNNHHKALIVGVSGASSSGKTTLARLLRDIFPNTFVLHEDDFYKPEDQLPKRGDLLDWDCPEAISVPDLEKALSYIHTHGVFPPFINSKEDQNSIGPCPVPESKITALKQKVSTWLSPNHPGHAIFHNSPTTATTTTTSSAAASTTSPPPSPPAEPPRICLLDGFLLYCPGMESAIMAQLDLKLFLQVSHAAMKARREARDGYVTLEGFWKDPPGYVDDVVWPNYAGAHAWLFEEGDVEGRIKAEVVREHGIRVQAGEEGVVDMDMETTLEWAVETLMAELEKTRGHHAG